MDHVLSCCTSKQINSFCLIDDGVKFDHVDKWVNEVVQRNVRKFLFEGSTISPCIFTCKTLTCLILHCHGPFSPRNIPTSFHLPNQKILNTDLIYPSGDFTEKLFSSCPVLEDLTIEGSADENILTISCPLLKRLTVRLEADCGILVWKLVINAPNLRDLFLINMFTTEYIVENLGSVVTAELRMGCCATTELFHSRAVRFLWEFGTVKSLSMDEFFIAVSCSISIHVFFMYNAI